MRMGQGTRRLRRLAGTAGVGMAVAAVMAAPSVHAAGTTAAAPVAGATYRVGPAQSVQQVVDAARPGDTVELQPGTYRQSVRITVSGLTLRGTAADQVTLAPAADAGAVAGSCGAAGDGVCVSGAKNVRIERLTVSGFAHYGIWGTAADGMTVEGVVAEKNEYGIGQQKSVRARFIGNVARNNREAGILLANAVGEEGGALDTQGARVSANALSGNKMGVVLRRVRNMTAEANDVSGNCAGVLVVGDEGVPRGGHLTVRANAVTDNTKFCPATSRLPVVQGSGIVLTGVEDTIVEDNAVTGNTGASPMSGGVVLFHSFVGIPNTGNAIRGNVVLMNGPADIADRDTGTGNVFSANSCGVSLPAGHC